MADLDAATWAAVTGYFDAALDLPPDALAPWLERLAADQPAVAAALRELLEQRRRLESQGFLAQPLIAPAGRPSMIDQRVGAYTIEALLGRGGMGEVWLAQRSDGRFAGSAAIKFLDLQSPAAGAQERFRREGRLLARLTHPHIARLIDAGVMPDGHPYLVLEYVSGTRIDEFCEQHALPIEARVRLFQDVLAAVAHAHTNLIIHRDIKPTNVLVTPDGAVKLLDFGVAKLIGGDPSVGDPANTHVEDIVLTPGYAAPEQILGEPVSTATDVYQLGVLLYVLLAHALPLLPTPSRASHIRAALDEQPLRLSDAAPVAQRRGLRGDLDAIVDKALRKRPADRYPTAAAFAQDLQRYLDHQPVQARDGVFSYRAQKFVRRYRRTVIGAASGAAALLLVTSFALWQMREAQIQRDASRYQEKRAEAESEFMTLMMSSVSDDERPVTPAQILDKGLELLDQQYADDPGFRITMLARMSARFMEAGDTQKGYATLLKAEGIAQTLGDPGQLAAVECDLVDTEIDRGHVDVAAARLEAGRAALARVPRPSASDRAECLDAAASLTAARGDTPAAIRTLLDAVALLEAAGAIRDVQYTDLLAHVAHVYGDFGDIKNSFAFHAREAAALERAGRKETSSYLGVQHELAGDLLAFGEVGTAYTRETAVIARARHSTADGSIPPHLSTTYGNLQLRLDRPAAALDSFDAALVATQRSGDLQSELYARAGRAGALLALRQVDAAAAELSEVLRRARGQETANRRALERAQIEAAAVAEARGQLPEAPRLIGATIARLRDAKAGGSAFLATADLTASRIAAAEHRFADAERAATDALAIAEQRARNPAASADVGEALLLIAEARQATGDHTAAHHAAVRAVVSLKNGLGAEHPLTLAAATLP